MTVSSHVEHGLDVTQFRTYEWGAADALPTGDPRLDKSPFFQDHMQGAIEKQMAARGFERAAAGASPDLLIHYHAVVDRRLDVNRVDRDHGLCLEGDCRVRVVEYEAGTIVLDVVEAHTGRLVWRGWAQSPMDGVIDHEDRLVRRVEEAARRMVARLPRPVK